MCQMTPVARIMMGKNQSIILFIMPIWDSIIAAISPCGFAVLPAALRAAWRLIMMRALKCVNAAHSTTSGAQTAMMFARVRSALPKAANISSGIDMYADSGTPRKSASRKDCTSDGGKA